MRRMSEPAQITVELSLVGAEIAGTVREAGRPDRSFDGMLELVSALEARRGEAPAMDGSRPATPVAPSGR